MLANTAFVLATFTLPEYITVNPQSTLWLLPLAVAIAIVYKATKLPTITLAKFTKEVVILSGSIVVFIIIAALTLLAFAWLVTE